MQAAQSKINHLKDGSKETPTGSRADSREVSRRTSEEGIADMDDDGGTASAAPEDEDHEGGQGGAGMEDDDEVRAQATSAGLGLAGLVP